MECSRPFFLCSHLFCPLLAFLSTPLLSSHLLQTLGQSLQTVQKGGSGRDDDTNVPKVYIVFVRQSEDMAHDDLEAYHKSFLPLSPLDSGKPRLVYSYSTAINGFAAWLTPTEVERLRDVEGFVDAEPDGPLELQTTHTTKFLGLTDRSDVWRSTSRGAGRLIGVIDTGIDPDHVSFAGAGMEQPFPRAWTGRCEFVCGPPGPCTCTKKLLGARTFNSSGARTPPDWDSLHGTAVASVAAGDFVGHADYMGYARGTASGAAPGAYLSTYNAGPRVVDSLAAIDQAIQDGVEVLSVSMGISHSHVAPSYHNSYAIATLRAVQAGAVVSMAAGNYGPDPGTVINVAPWQMTVGACTHDRALAVTVVLHALGRRVRFDGIAQADPDRVFRRFTVPRRVVYPGATGGAIAKSCNRDLGGVDVTRAMVMCWRDPHVSPYVQAQTVKSGRGAVMVLMDDRKRADRGFKHLVPFLAVFTVALRQSDSNQILGHLKSGRPLKAHISPLSSTLGVHPYPVVPGFSGRGPSRLTSGILKPDILGPGVYILAAANHTSNEFVLNTGTSFATPHLSAVAALLKSMHPNWSPAAIRSAIMTTADTTNSLGGPITDHVGQNASFYATGAGLVNPRRAADPGLVYDIPDTDDYLRFVCSQGYKQQFLNRFDRDGYLDCTELGMIRPEELNYPSITAVMKPLTRKTITRTVTNVGPAMSDYSWRVDGIRPEVSVMVSPPQLRFTRTNERKSFNVTIHRKRHVPGGTVVDGYLRWESTVHVVTSPLSIVFP